MPIPVASVIFVIEASVKLGRKIYEVALDETIARPLNLPPAWTPDNIDYPTALDFFEMDENQHYVGEGGLYHTIYNGALDGVDEMKAELVVAYKEAAPWEAKTPAGGTSLKEVKTEVKAFEQFVKEQEPLSPVRRILGTIVEIGIDYFVANPDALMKDSPARSVVTAVAEAVADTDFAEGESEDVIESILKAGLSVFESHGDIIIGDKKLQSLVGGVCKAMREDYKKLARVPGTGSGVLEERKGYYRQLASTFLRGAGTAIAGSPEAWFDDENTQVFVETAVGNVLVGLEDYEDNYFTAKTLEVIVQSSFGAVSQHATFFGNSQIIQGILKEGGKALSVIAITDYGPDTVGKLLAISVQVVGDNAGSFIHGDRQKLMEAAVQVTATNVARLLENGQIKKLFTAKQVEDLFKGLLLEVAKDPEILLGEGVPGTPETVLSMVVGAVAEAFGQTQFAHIDDNFVKDLVYTCVRIAVRNSDKLLATQDLNPGQTLICKALKAYFGVIFASVSLPQEWPKSVFVEGTDKFLEAISTHLESEEQLDVVVVAVQVVLDFSRQALAGKINGRNFARVAAELVIKVLKGTPVDDGEDTKKLVESLA